MAHIKKNKKQVMGSILNQYFVLEFCVKDFPSLISISIERSYGPALKEFVCNSLDIDIDIE